MKNDERYDFQNKSWPEIAAFQQLGAILILPIGSTEAHGPHLPLSTDYLISQEMARRAAAQLTAKGKRTLVLPAISYSVTDFSNDFPGSISISSETAISVIKDVCRAVIKQGFRYLCFANSHLELAHIQSLEKARQDLETEFSIKIAFPDKCRRRWATTLTKEFQSGACHAGSYESSLVMAVRPDLVNDALRQQLPEVNISLSDAMRAGINTFKEAGGELAYFGAPAQASSDEGEGSYDALATMLVTAILETYPELAQ